MALKGEEGRGEVGLLWALGEDEDALGDLLPVISLQVSPFVVILLLALLRGFKRGRREDEEEVRGERRRSPRSSPSSDLEGEGWDRLREGEGREDDLREGEEEGGRLRVVEGGESSLDREWGESRPCTRRTSTPLPFSCAMYPFSCTAMILIESPKCKVSWRCFIFNFGIVVEITGAVMEGEGGTGVGEGGMGITVGDSMGLIFTK